MPLPLGGSTPDRRRSPIWAAAALALLSAMLLFPAASRADLYSGSLNAGTDGGLLGTEQWNSVSTVLTWSITYQQQNSNWIYTYNYTFTVPKKDISHVITQVSESFTTGNIFGGTTLNYSLATYSSSNGNSNPGMPASYLGLKWNTDDVLGKDAPAKTFSWTIVTDRAPMWGSFYAKDGKSGGSNGQFVYAYATGNVSVPDTQNGPPPVPLPASAWLLGSALAGLVGIKLRLRRAVRVRQMKGGGIPHTNS